MGQQIKQLLEQKDKSEQFKQSLKLLPAGDEAINCLRLSQKEVTKENKFSVFSPYKKLFFILLCKICPVALGGKETWTSAISLFSFCSRGAYLPA